MLPLSSAAPPPLYAKCFLSRNATSVIKQYWLFLLYYMGSTGFFKCVPADFKATFDQTIDSTALDFDVDRHFLMSNKKQIIIIGGNLDDMRKTNCEEVREFSEI